MMKMFPDRKVLKKYRKTLWFYYILAFKTRNRKLRQMRKQALRLLDKQLQALARQRYHEAIILGIAEKKADIIMQLYSAEEFGALLACSYPHFDGAQYVSSVPETHYIPEEECVHWANFFDGAMSSRAGQQRYDEVLALVFPHEGEEFIRELQKNKLRDRRY